MNACLSILVASHWIFVMLGLASEMQVKIVSVENKLTLEEETSIRDRVALPNQNYYLEIISSRSDRGRGSSTHPPLAHCLKLHQWASEHDRVLFVRSNRGAATYRWDHLSQTGNWLIDSGTNPLYSNDQLLLLTEVDQLPNWFSFSIVTKQLTMNDDLKAAAVSLVRSFTNHKAWINLRPDYFYWPGSCGRPGPQVHDLHLKYIPGQVPEATETCLLEAGKSECKWRTEPNQH